MSHIFHNVAVYFQLKFNITFPGFLLNFGYFLKEKSAHTFVFWEKKFENNHSRIREIFTYSLSNQGFIFAANGVEIGQEPTLWELVIIKRKLK